MTKPLQTIDDSLELMACDDCSGYPTERHKQAKAQLQQLIEWVIGEDLGEGDDQTFAYYENNLRAEQRKRLTSIMKGTDK